MNDAHQRVDDDDKRSQVLSSRMLLMLDAHVRHDMMKLQQ